MVIQEKHTIHTSHYLYNHVYSTFVQKLAEIRFICAIDIKQRFNAQSSNPRNHIRAVPQRDQNGRFVELYELRQLDNSKTIPGLSHLIFAHRDKNRPTVYTLFLIPNP